MRYAFLVAWREFAENAKTKGFWIGILIFPLIITGSMSLGGLLEKTKPVRNFVLLDRTGKLEAPIKVALDRLYQREVMKALEDYKNKYSARAADVSGITAEQLEKLSASDMENMGRQQAGARPGTAERLAAPGELERELEKLKPDLRSDAPAFEPPRRPFRRVELPSAIRADLPADELAESLKPYLSEEGTIEVDGAREDLFAAVIVPADAFQRIVRPNLLLPVPERLGIQYWSANLADEDLKDAIEDAANEEVRRVEYDAEGVDTEAVARVQKTYIPFASLNPKKEAGEEAVSIADKIRQWAPIGFVYLLWVGIFTISQMLLNNTIEEKSNRIIEVLLSSVTPGELMMGKLAGIAAVGLTMIGAWLISLVLVLVWKAGPEAQFATELLKVLRTSGLLPAFLVYFFFGYLLYAGAFLAIGSLCNTLKEAQNMMGPIMVIMMVPLMTMAFIPKDPNGTLATVLSWIPFYTPFIMMNRAAADPPMFDRVGTMILLILSTILVLWLSGRIFRLGILRTGQPPKLRELVRWMKSA